MVYNSAGRVTRYEDRSQIKTFVYDKLGRIIEETRESVQTGDSFVTSFEYDLINRKKVIHYPEDKVTGNELEVKYTYAVEGVNSVKSRIDGVDKFIITGCEYNEFGQILSVVRGNNTRTDYSYDIKGRLAGLKTILNDNGLVSTLQDVSYDFKVDNSIRGVVNSPELTAGGAFNGSINYNYSYDGLNRLIDASGNFTNGSEAKSFNRKYGYSTTGNLISKEMVSTGEQNSNDNWNYVYSNHRVDSVSSSGSSSGSGAVFSMQYDMAGNTISKIDHVKGLAKEMVYDSENRIYKVLDSNSNDMVLGEYFYDDQGFRVRKVSVQQRNFGDANIELLTPSMYVAHERELDGSGDVISGSEYTVNNIYINGVRAAAIAAEGQARYYLTDQVDSVKVVLDDDGLPVTNTEYLPYGETWFQTGDSFNSPKFNSQELDKESGFYFYNARHYDGAVARFVTADTVIDGEYSISGWNRYMYCGGNPVIYRDPTGHEALPKSVPVYRTPKPDLRLVPNSSSSATSTAGSSALKAASRVIGAVGLVFTLQVDMADGTMNQQRAAKINEILENKDATVQDLANVMMKASAANSDEERKYKNSVNIDTNIIETMASNQSSRTINNRRRQISNYIEKREKIISMTALSEIFDNTRARATAREMMKVAVFLSDTRVVEDTVRADILNVDLPELGSRDRIILSTGANLGVPTITQDKYMNFAVKKLSGVKIKFIKNPPASFTGKKK